MFILLAKLAEVEVNEPLILDVNALNAMSVASEALNVPVEPLMSAAIWAELDSTPLVDNKEPVIPLDTLTLPVYWCVSSSVLPNIVEPELRITDELIVVVIKLFAVTVPSTFTFPWKLEEPVTSKTWLS